MRISKTALKILAARECGIFKTNAQFWGGFKTKEELDEVVSQDNNIIASMEKLSIELDSNDMCGGAICVFDEEFPIINSKVKNGSEKPYLLFYRGDISLLNNLNNNVTVIGLINPHEEIIKREVEIVENIVKVGQVVVSGLAMGCDTIAHKTCLETGGKTIAILPSQINKVQPAENRELAERIVSSGGLLLSEYYKDPDSKYEAINRFIERDRLQAMFAKAIILIASYRKGEGDSGARHAMEAARKYGVNRYIMLNKKTDIDNIQFGLNVDILSSKNASDVEIMQESSIDRIKNLANNDLLNSTSDSSKDQLSFL